MEAIPSIGGHNHLDLACSYPDDVDITVGSNIDLGRERAVDKDCARGSGSGTCTDPRGAMILGAGEAHGRSVVPYGIDLTVERAGRIAVACSPLLVVVITR